MMSTLDILAEMSRRNMGNVLPHTQNPNRPEYLGSLPWETGKANSSKMNLTGLMQQMEAQQQAANAANEKRYNELLALADRYGAGQRQASMDLTQQQQAMAGSSLTSRGLGNSTIVDSVRQGIARQGQRSLADIEDRVAQQKMGIIERKTEKGPDLGLYAQLLMQKGALG